MRLYEKKADPFYATAAWKAARNAAMLRAGGMCEDCIEEWEHCEGIRPQPATVVHHMLPLSQHPELALNMGNLRCLCANHHAKRHPEKGRSATVSGGDTPYAETVIVKI